MVSRVWRDALALLVCCAVGTLPDAVASMPALASGWGAHLLNAGAVPHGPSGLGIYVAPRFALAVACAWAWVAVTGMTGIAMGLVLAGIIGDLPERLRWAPFGGVFLGVVLTHQKVVSWMVAPSGVVFPQLATEAAVLNASLLVAAAVCTARCVAGLSGVGAARVGLCLCWWLLSTSPPPGGSLSTLPTLYHLGGSVVGLAAELVATGLSIQLSLVVLNRVARKLGAVDTPEDADLPPASGWLVAGCALVLPLLAVGAAALPGAGPQPQPWSAATLLVTGGPEAPALLGVGVGGLAVLAVATVPLDRLMDGGRISGLLPIGAAVAWFAGVAPRLFPPVSTSAFQDWYYHVLRTPPSTPVTVAALAAAGLIVYLVLRQTCDLERRAALSLAGAFLIWMAVDSPWVLPRLHAAVTRPAHGPAEILAQAALFTALGATAAITQVCAQWWNGARRRGASV